MEETTVTRTISRLVLEIFIGVITSAILIAWYDTFCDRKSEEENFLIPIIWYIIINIALIHFVNYVLSKYLANNEVMGMITTIIQLVQEILLGWGLIVSKYKGNIKKKIFFFVPYIIAIPAVEMIVLVIMNKDLAFSRNSSYYIEAINNVTLLIAMYLVILTIGAIYSYINYKKRNPQFVFFAIILIMQLVLHYFFEKAFLTTADESKMNWYLTGYIFSAIILLCISAIYQNHLKELEYKRLENERQRTWKQEADYYQAKSMATTELQKREHDSKKQLLIISQLLRENKYQELETYLESVIVHTSPSVKVVEAGNAVVSAILTVMVAQCRENDIVFKPILKYKTLRIEDFDLSTILGNVLENAFEASLRVDNTNKRSIKLSIQEEKNIILIRCENYYEGMLDGDGASLRSSKADKGKHGLGLGNIQDATEKYNGKVSVETREQIFEIQIVLWQMIK